jgi:hypothetical protein
MGTGFRVLLIDHNGILRRMSMRRYERLINPDSAERLLEYAGKKLRFVYVVLDLLRRKPVAIKHIDYFMLSFDATGRVDCSEWDREAALIGEMVSIPLLEPPHETVIDARRHFAKKRYFQEFKWTPSQEVETAIMTAIFGEDHG